MFVDDCGDAGLAGLKERPSSLYTRGEQVDDSCENQLPNCSPLVDRWKKGAADCSWSQQMSTRHRDLRSITGQIIAMQNLSRRKKRKKEKKKERENIIKRYANEKSGLINEPSEYKTRISAFCCCVYIIHIYSTLG